MVRIGIDLDGVLFDFDSEVVQVINTLWPEKKITADYVPTGWDYDEILEPGQWKIVWDTLLRNPNLWFDEESYPESIIATREYMEDHSEVEVYFLTARAQTYEGDSALKQSSMALALHGLHPHKGNASVIVVPSSGLKKQVIEAIGLTHYLDDKEDTIDVLQDVHGLKALVLDKPYNRDNTLVPRVFSVEQFFKVVEADRIAQGV